MFNRRWKCMLPWWNIVLVLVFAPRKSRYSNWYQILKGYFYLLIFQLIDARYIDRRGTLSAQLIHRHAYKKREEGVRKLRKTNQQGVMHYEAKETTSDKLLDNDKILNHMPSSRYLNGPGCLPSVASFRVPFRIFLNLYTTVHPSFWSYSARNRQEIDGRIDLIPQLIVLLRANLL